MANLRTLTIRLLSKSLFFSLVILLFAKPAFSQDTKIGKEISNKFSSTGSLFNRQDSKYDEHPWAGLAGRNVVESKVDWALESIKSVLGEDFDSDAEGLGEAVGKLKAMEEIYSKADGAGSLLPVSEKFMKCLEPRVVFQGCEYCNPHRMFRAGAKSWSSCPRRRNMGYVFAYWWPEAVIEVNNFGISSYNPLNFIPRNDDAKKREATLYHPVLKQQIDTFYKVNLAGCRSPINNELLKTPRCMALYGGKFDLNLPEGVRTERNLGRSSYVGLSPGDQTEYTEAHVYQSFVSRKMAEKREPKKGRYGLWWKKIDWLNLCVPRRLFWYNGYREVKDPLMGDFYPNKQCFYTSLQGRKPIVHAWTEEMNELNKNYFGFFWRIPEMSQYIDNPSKNFYAASHPPYAPMGNPKGMIPDVLSQYQVPASYIVNRSCASYRAERWPDRYRELQIKLGIVPNDWEYGNRLCYKGGGELFPVTGMMQGQFKELVSAAYFARRALYLSSRHGLNKTAKFSDRADKLQRISPDLSDCFGVQDIDDLDDKLFPKQGKAVEQVGPEKSIRYMYWNMRTACACEYRGTYPIPYLELAGESDFYTIPFGEGCHVYRRTSRSRGMLANQPKEDKLFLAAPLIPTNTREEPQIDNDLAHIPPYPNGWPLAVPGADLYGADFFDYTESVRQLYPFLELDDVKSLVPEVKIE